MLPGYKSTKPSDGTADRGEWNPTISPICGINNCGDRHGFASKTRATLGRTGHLFLSKDSKRSNVFVGDATRSSGTVTVMSRRLMDARHPVQVKEWPRRALLNANGKPNNRQMIISMPIRSLR